VTDKNRSSSSKQPSERAILVGVTLPRSNIEIESSNLDELELLAKTAGADVAGRTVQRRTRIDGSTYIGEGKLGELEGRIADWGANLIIFDDDLSPAQARNIENRLDVNVIDRTELILDIFSRRARTRQAKIQVEIAQLTYALPRLRRLWKHLSRQAGGIGTRGPGETQLEADRRRVREKIARLKRELRRIRRGTGERRKRRRDIFKVTIVGYTNAGKSTLLNRLAGSNVEESRRLFSTLDSTTRRISRIEGRDFLLTDTIGFIRKLPPYLIESFRATLLDVRKADLLFHIVDAAAPGFEGRIDVVNAVLEDVLAARKGDRGGENDIPTLLLLNKVDVLEDPESRRSLERGYPGAVLISASKGEGMGELLSRTREYSERDMMRAEIEVPVEDGRAIAEVERLSRVYGRKAGRERITYDVMVKKRNLSLLERVGRVKLKPLKSP